MSKTKTNQSQSTFLESVNIDKIRSVFPELDAHIDFLSQLQNHKYKNLKIAATCLLHRSALVYWPTNKSGVFSFEKLEFLGDALVNSYVAQQALFLHPDLNEGALSKLRAFIVGTQNLAQKSRELNLGDFILFGKSENKTPYKNQDNILADAFESITAALFLDAGSEFTKEWLRTIFYEQILKYKENVSSLDSKGKLQHWVQDIISTPPVYKTLKEEIIDSIPHFTVAVYVGNFELARAQARNKKDASKNAATQALKLIDEKQLTEKLLLEKYAK